MAVVAPLSLSIVALTLAAAAPAPRPNPFCDAQRKAAAGAASGFVAVRGPLVAATGAPALEVYRPRVVLPDAVDCTVTVPRRSRRPAAYACSFSAGVDVKRAMGRLVRRSARCADIAVGNPPRLKDGPNGPSFYFDSGIARYDFSAAPAAGRPGLWMVTVAISKGPRQPRRPLV